MQDVTPFTGVWIEMLTYRRALSRLPVTPFTGVWIEIPQSMYTAPHPHVTPFTGVWIEISRLGEYLGRGLCHTLHGCVD